MFQKIGLSFVLIAMLSGCSLASRNESASLDSGLAVEQPTQALVFQNNDMFAKFLGAEDRKRLMAAELRALDYGQAREPIPWTSKNGKIDGTVVAYQLYRVGTLNCRRFEHTVLRRGETSASQATACKGADGGWRLVQ